MVVFLISDIRPIFKSCNIYVYSITLSIITLCLKTSEIVQLCIEIAI